MTFPQRFVSGPAFGLVEGLTPREKDILALLADGLGNREIATYLDLREKTVRNRISEILNKIGASNRTQAALWARERGLKRDRSLFI